MSSDLNGDTAQPRDANRRRFLQRAGIAGVAAVGVGALGVNEEKAEANSRTTFGSAGHKFYVTDYDILNFALNLEYLEAEFYLRATTGSGLAANEVNGVGTLGNVTGGSKVPFTNKAVKEIATELAANEHQHVLVLRSFLNKYTNLAVARPTINFTDTFTAAAVAAGIIPKGQTFDPFSNDAYFMLGAFVFEDVGVTAYNGAAPFIVNPSILGYAASILGIEAYHGGAIRDELFTIGQTTPAVITAANAITALRAGADGSPNGGHEQPLTDANGNVIISPADSNSLAFARTFQEVLSIVYLGGAAGNYGFFPNMLNGRIK